MNLLSWLPPALVGFAAKSLGFSTAAWIRGDDVTDGVKNRLVSPYAQSAWIRAAVNHIAGEIAGRALKFYDGDREHADAAFADWWAAPAIGPRVLGQQQRLPLADVLRDLSAWASLEGEFFIVLDDAWLIGIGRRNPASLPPFLIARPDRMQAIVMGGTLTGWRFTDAGGRQFTFVPEQVLHWMDFNPYDDWRGVGGLQAARVAADGAFLTGAYIRDLMRNNGDQGAIVIGKNGVVDDKQKEQITAALRSKRALLERGIAKDLFLTGDITVDRPAQQAAGADLVATQSSSQQEVFVAFGVPPSMAAVKQSYSVGKESDRYQLITGTCQPRGAAIAGLLAKIGSRMAGNPLTAELDWDDHPVMVEVRNSRIDSLQKLWGMGVPVKNANDYLDLGLEAFPGWDVGYLPFSVAPTGDAGAGSKEQGAGLPENDPEMAETPAEEDAEIAKIRLLVLARSRAAQLQCRQVSATEREFAAFACTCGHNSEPGTQNPELRERDEREVAHWRTLMAKRRETMKSFQSAFTRVLMAARVETLKRIESGYTPAGKSQVSGLSPQVSKSAAADFLFALDKFTAAFRTAMENQQRTALQLSGDQLFTELGKKDDPFRLAPIEVLDFLDKRKNKLRDVPQSVFDSIKATLQEGIDAGDTQAQLAGRVKAAFNDLGDGEARRIAQTETGAAYGAGRALAMKQAGVQRKRWLTSGNANVRPAHAAANGQTVAIDEPFIVDGEALMHPGDDAGSAGNTINCHCVSIAVAE